MDNEREIIYIALSNLILVCNEALEDATLNQEGIELNTYLVEGCLQLLDKYKEEIINEPIKRPSW